MKFENTEVWGFNHAIRGMRNPMNSWAKSDSRPIAFEDLKDKNVNENGLLAKFIIGKNDMELMQRLIKAGSEHRKFMRQIFVSVDITAPRMFWTEFDQYKTGVITNSTSTMHTIQKEPITMDCFEMGDFENTHYDFIDLESHSEIDYNNRTYWAEVIKHLEYLRIKYNETKDKRYWKELLRLLPNSWLQTRTITMNYENILNMYHQRKNHKLNEWKIDFCNWVKSLPYAKELIIGE